MAERLRGEGLLQREIAERLGIARTYVSELLRDPDGLKLRERHDRARGTCEDCGAPTGWPGKTGPSKRCNPCNGAAQRIWTREVCIEAIRDFHREHGRVPTAGELGTGSYYMEYVEGLPHGWTLWDLFGGIAPAMRAAGFKPNPPGYYVQPSKVIARAR